MLRVKRLMQRLRVLAYQTASQLKYCSPLGGLLVELRRSQGLKGVGEKTAQKLEAIGAMTFPVLAQMTDEQFVAAGISTKIGNRIRAYVGGEFVDRRKVERIIALSLKDLRDDHLPDIGAIGMTLYDR